MKKRERTITELREKSKRQEQIISIVAQVFLRKGARRLAGEIAASYRKFVGERLPRVPRSVVDEYLAEETAYRRH
ncbi:hypothetical protein LCGC14_2934770 [marine sediment metagenome]|uniref:Uncharacterized protein n=1 Tax=marine sediment metagenome TaxID=412755 RepID=A0A0F8XJU9_9ZZZZ